MNIPASSSAHPRAISEVFSEEQTGINRQRFELIAAVTVTAQSWQLARLPSLAARSSEERPD